MFQTYTVFLDLILLVVPLFLMVMSYGAIAYTLWKGIQIELRNAQGKEVIINTGLIKLSYVILHGSETFGDLEASCYLPSLER